jgi:hypothetical protein
LATARGGLISGSVHALDGREFLDELGRQAGCGAVRGVAVF